MKKKDMGEINGPRRNMEDYVLVVMGISHCGVG